MDAREEHVKVLVTGAYGLIGNTVYAALVASGRYDVYGLTRRIRPSARMTDAGLATIPPERTRVADLTNAGSLRDAVRGVDVVVHMAADPSGRDGWHSVHQNNVVGTQHLFEAASEAGVRRVVFASTIQVIFGYRDTHPYGAILSGDVEGIDPDEIAPITSDRPVRPLSFYASSKVWGEALAHMYAHAHGMSCFSLRIGWVTADDRPHRRAIGTWCSRRDIAQLTERCVAAPEDLRYGVFFGLSRNRYNIADIEHAGRLVGYVPADTVDVHDPGGGIHE